MRKKGISWALLGVGCSLIGNVFGDRQIITLHDPLEWLVQGQKTYRLPAVDAVGPHYGNIYSKICEGLKIVHKRNEFGYLGKVTSPLHIVELEGYREDGEGCPIPLGGVGTMFALESMLEHLSPAKHGNEISIVFKKLLNEKLYEEDISFDGNFEEEDSYLEEVELENFLKSVSEYTGRPVFFTTVRSSSVLWQTCFEEFFSKIYCAKPTEGLELLIGYGTFIGEGLSRVATVECLADKSHRLNWSDEEILKAIGRLKCTVRRESFFSRRRSSEEEWSLYNVLTQDEDEQPGALFFILDEDTNRLFWAYEGVSINFGRFLKSFYRKSSGITKAADRALLMGHGYYML